MAQQKSEDRVVPKGGVMPAERGATRRRTRVRLGEIRAGAPKAIDKTGTATPATMDRYDRQRSIGGSFLRRTSPSVAADAAVR